MWPVDGPDLHSINVLIESAICIINPKVYKNMSKTETQPSSMYMLV